jgi:hypothetical protein
MTAKQSLDEIFAKAGIPRVSLTELQRRERNRTHGALKAMKFAQLYVRHNFSALKAYEEFTAPNPPRNSRQWAFAWSQNPTVQRFVREILHEAIVEAQEFTRNDLAEMLALNRLLIYGDITALLEERRVYDIDQEGKRLATFRSRIVLRPLSTLTHAERMLVKRIRFKDGEVIGIEGYDRLDAQRTQLALLQAIHNRGGADGDFNSELQRRINEARSRRIAIEEEAIRSGKLVRLPSKGAA